MGEHASSPRAAGLISLRYLLARGRPTDTLVAFGTAGERRWRDFAAHVANLSQALRRAGGGDWLLYSEDSYAFAVALLASAHAGCTAILPPNRQPGTLRRLGGLAVGAVVDPDESAYEPRPAQVLHPLAAPATAPAALAEVDGDTLVARFFTSGTTGEGSAVGKRLRHLDDEVAALEEQFGGSLGGATRVYATVSHQHIYGALLRVLWPLAAGRPFCSDTFLHSEEILPRVAAAPSALVTTPIHLRTMVASGAVRALPRDIAVFTSGGPLDSATAAAVGAAVQSPVYEILGSTETGGVAWRQRPRGGDVAWTPFSAVRIGAAEDGRLVVTSPFVSVGEATEDPDRQRFAMGDAVELVDGGFHLRGRADRVVKIGARRLSLPEMEGRLREHPYVREAALVTMPRGGESRVGAAVVLSEAGQKAGKTGGLREVGGALAAHLAPYWDRALLPRAWRYVDALPADSQGKVTREALLRLFAEPVPVPRPRNSSPFSPAPDTRAGVAPPQNIADIPSSSRLGTGADCSPKMATNFRNGTLVPELLAERRGGDSLEVRLRVPADLAFLDGHFPTTPVVAGVVQVRWAADLAARLLGTAARVAAIEALKFKTPLLPNEEFSLAVEISAERDKVRFRLWDGDREFSSGRLLLQG